MVRKPQTLLLLPLILAYVFKGGKTGLTFLPVFAISLILFVFAFKDQESRALPKDLTLLFGGFLVWCWLGLLNNPPLDSFLISYSKICLYFLVGVWVFQYSISSTARHFELTLVALGLIETAFIFYGTLQGHYVQMSGYLHNPIHSGTLLPVSFGLAVLRAKESEKQNQRIAWIIISTALLWALVVMRMRSAVISTGVIMLFLFPKNSLRVAVGTVALLAGFYALYGSDLWIHLKVDPLSLKSNFARFGIWGVGLEAIQAKPIIGWGLGNFESAYQLFQRPSEYGLRYAHTTIFAHNGFLQTAAEAGLPAALMLFVGLGLVMKRSCAFVSENRGLFVVVIVFAVASIFNYSMYLPFSGLILAVALALLAAKFPSKNFLRLSHLKLIPTLILSLLALSAVGSFASDSFRKKGTLRTAALVYPLRSEVWYELAMESLSHSENPLPFLRQAINWNSWNGFYWHRNALVLVNYNPEEQDAINFSFKQAHVLMPFHTPFYIDEGVYRLMTRKYDAAETLLEKAAELEPEASTPHKWLAILQKKKGNRVAAIEEQEKYEKLQQRYLDLTHNPNALRYRELFSSSYARYMFNDEK